MLLEPSMEQMRIYQDFLEEYKALYFNKELGVMITEHQQILNINPAMSTVLFESKPFENLHTSLNDVILERLQKMNVRQLHLGSKQSAKVLWLLPITEEYNQRLDLLALRLSFILSSRERPQLIFKQGSPGADQFIAANPAALHWLSTFNSDASLFKAIHPLDLPQFLTFLKEAPDHPSSRIRLKLSGQGGNTQQIYCMAYPYTSDGEAKLYLMFEEPILQDALDLRHRESQEHLHSLFEGSREPMLIVDQQFRIQEANLAFYNRYGFSEEKLIRVDLNDLLSNSIVDRRQHLYQTEPTAAVTLMDYYGQAHELHLYELPVYLEDAPIGKYICLMPLSMKPGITFKKLAQSLSQVVPPQAILTDPNLSVLWTSSANWISGEFSIEGILNQNLAHFVAKQSQADLKQALTSIEGGQAWFGGLWLESPQEKQRLRHGLISPLIDLNGELLGYSFKLYPIHRERELNALIQRLSYIDPETDCQNASAIATVLSELIYEASARQERFALVDVQLSTTSKLTEALSESDKQQFLEVLLDGLLPQLDDLMDCFRSSETGFSFLLRGVHLDNELQRLYVSLLRSLSSRIELLGFEDSLHLSFAYALYPHSGHTTVELLSSLSQSKKHFESLYADMCLSEQLSEGQRPKEGMIERYLREGLPKGEFYIVYQPLIDLKTKQITGMETLLRWHSDAVGSLSPGEFIPIAEKSNLIVKLGYFVIGETIRKLYQLREKGHVLTSSVNISLKQLEEPDFAGKIIDMLDTYELPGNAIEFEITESITTSANPMVAKNIDALTRYGIAFNVDDFGTGYSSLKQMQQLAIKSLKVDRSLIEDMVDNPNNQSLVRAISAMAKSSGLKLIAEGVETQEQLSVLEQIGFEEAQGFLFSMPLKDQDLERFIEDHQMIHGRKG